MYMLSFAGAVAPAPGAPSRGCLGNVEGMFRSP